jgi:hypothetical protein
MPKVKHIALIKFKAGTSEEQIEKIFDEILEMSETIPGVDDYVAGPNTSPEGLNQGHTHAFVMTMSDAAARDGYLAHPEHVRVGGLLKAMTDSIVVFDFEV